MIYDWKKIFTALETYKRILENLGNSDDDMTRVAVVHQSLSKYLETLHTTSLDMVQTYDKIAMKIIEKQFVEAGEKVKKLPK